MTSHDQPAATANFHGFHMEIKWVRCCRFQRPGTQKKDGSDIEILKGSKVSFFQCDLWRNKMWNVLFLNEQYITICSMSSLIVTHVANSLQTQPLFLAQSANAIGRVMRHFSVHFFLPPLSSPSPLRSQLTTLPSITTPLPSMKATRERPSQFLKVSQTNGCCGWKLH